MQKNCRHHREDFLKKDHSASFHKRMISSVLVGYNYSPYF